LQCGDSGTVYCNTIASIGRMVGKRRINKMS